MMDQSEVLDLLEKVGAFRAGHIVLTSGRHTDSYVNKDALYPYTHDTSTLCKAMAEKFKDSDVEVVVGPTMGAAILAQLVAYHLTDVTGREIFGVYADKDGQGGFVLRRGYDQIVKGKNILVVEDLTTTGGSIKKVVEVSRDAGGNVIGAIVIVNRGGVTKEQVGDPPIFTWLVELHLESWDESECELCEKGIPVNTDIGHGKEFLARKNG